MTWNGCDNKACGKLHLGLIFKEKQCANVSRRKCAVEFVDRQLVTMVVISFTFLVENCRALFYLMSTKVGTLAEDNGGRLKH